MSLHEHGFRTPYHFDMALQEPVFYIERRGIRIDQEEKLRFHREYHERWDEAQTKLNGLARRELNVNSHPQMKRYLYKELNLPTRKYQGRVTTNEDALRSLLAYSEDKMNKMKTRKASLRYARAHLSLLQILKIRALRKRISSYIDINIDEDGRMRQTLSVGATETARFSSSKTLWDTGCNIQTIPRELRSMFIADEGYELAEFDLNRGESWIYSHLAEDIEMMEIHRQGRDFHSITAAAISTAFGKKREAEEIIAKKADEEWAYKLRFLGKKTNHASAYRMGPFRFAEVVNEEADDTGITVVVSQTKEAQRLWLDKYFCVPEWWNAIERQLSEDRTMTTPFGRIHTYHDFWGKSLFKEATAYVPQSTSVDYLNLGMLRVYRDLVESDALGIELLHQNHDSILIQYPIENRDEVIPTVMEALGSHAVTIEGYRTGTRHRIRIPIEASYGPSWGDLTEWKEAA